LGDTVLAWLVNFRAARLFRLGDGAAVFRITGITAGLTDLTVFWVAAGSLRDLP
jgi:hypothetical protein